MKEDSKQLIHISASQCTQNPETPGIKPCLDLAELIVGKPRPFHPELHTSVLQTSCFSGGGITIRTFALICSWGAQNNGTLPVI